LNEIGKWIGREDRAERVRLAAESLLEHDRLDDDALIAAVTAKVIPEGIGDIAMLAVPVGEQDESEEPVIISKGVLRVAGRFIGEGVDRRNRLTDGRMAVARMIGYSSASRRAHLALMELSTRVCKPAAPECTECPLATWCASSETDELESNRLPFGPS